MFTFFHPASGHSIKSREDSNARKFDSFPFCQELTLPSTPSYRRSRSSSSAATAAFALAKSSVAELCFWKFILFAFALSDVDILAATGLADAGREICDGVAVRLGTLEVVLIP